MQYTLSKDGNKKIHALYDRRYMPNGRDILPENVSTGNLIKWTGEGNAKVHFKIKSKASLARRIFTDFLLLILKLVAEGNTVMLFGKTDSYIALQSIPDDEVKKLRQMGRYSDYDIVRANFKIPRFVLDFGPNVLRQPAQIYPTKAIQNLALRNAEKGNFTYIEYRKT